VAYYFSFDMSGNLIKEHPLTFSSSEFMEHFIDIFLNIDKAYFSSNPENYTFDKLFAKTCFIFSTIT
jgi:hypothetical protein